MGKPIKLTIGKTKGIDLDITKKEQINLNFTDRAIGSYPPLTNKPSINDVILIGNKTFEELGVQTMTNAEIKEVFDKVFSKGGD